VLPASAWPEKTGTVSNTDRMVQLGRQALQPPGDARSDLWILQRLAAGLGLPWNYENDSKLSNKHAGYHGVELVYEEMRRAMHGAIGGITWERLQHEDSVTYPCHSADDPGQAILFQDHVNTPDGRIHLVPADIIPANERPDADYPFVLITGRLLEHWHTGSMTRRSQVLDALEPHASASLCSADLHRLGVRAGDVITVRSRRGAVTLRARQDEGTPPGTVFMPFAYHEAAANLMTNPALDPVGKIPEVKYCAVAVQVGGTLAESVGYA
jgi:formate dehydrogenase major subunit